MMNKDIISKNITKRNLPIPVLSDSDGLDQYMQSVNCIPILTEEQEKQLTQKLKYQNDIKAAHKLVVSHLRFVIKIARGFSGYGLPINDLIQEGNIGLMKAVKKFDPNVGVRLVSFAVHWIKAEMHEYIIRNWRIVKVATTKSQRKLFFNLRSSKSHIGWFSNSEIKKIAQELGVKTNTVIEMEKRMNSKDITLDPPINNNNKINTTIIEDNSNNPEHINEKRELYIKMKDKLKNAVEKLDGRSKEIILSRWFTEKKATLKNLAIKYNISAERVRQIEETSIQKIKNLIINL